VTRSVSPIGSPRPAQGEFYDLEEICEERGLPWTGRPAVERRYAAHQGRQVSCIVWGENPDLVLLHGGAQNAHTWDAFALALGRPVVAVDLPGHGHSDWDETYTTVSIHRPSWP
jgi:pimeloyl-ACP methyl ester carboxylesterase